MCCCDLPFLSFSFCAVRTSFVSPAPAAPVTPDQPVTAFAPDDDPVPLLMRAWRDVGDRLPHIPAATVWTDWAPTPSWILPLPNIRSVSLIALGLYEFESKTELTRIFSLLEAPYFNAYLFLAAERRFIAWRQVHAYFHSSYETYEKAVRATNTGGMERRLYEALFGQTLYQPGRCCKTVNQAMVAVHEANPLTVGPDQWATTFMARPVAWETHVWDLSAVRPLTKVIPGTMPDSVMYAWLTDVPLEDAPFVVSVLSEHGTRALNDIKGRLKRPPDGFDGPYLEMAYYSDILLPTDSANPTTNDEFVNRLMHFMPDYVLSDISSGRPAQGAPAPGMAPVPLARRADPWTALFRGEQEELQATYPHVSTNWMSWTDVERRCVLVLLAPITARRWYNLLRNGDGGQAAGEVYLGGGPFEWWFSPAEMDGPGFKALLDQAPGNGLEERLKKIGLSGSQGLSSNTPTAQPPQHPPASHDPPESGSAA